MELYETTGAKLLSSIVFESDGIEGFPPTKCAGILILAILVQTNCADHERDIEREQVLTIKDNDEENDVF